MVFFLSAVSLWWSTSLYAPDATAPPDPTGSGISPLVGLQSLRSTRAMAHPEDERSRSSRRSLFRTALAAGGAYAARCRSCRVGSRSSEDPPRELLRTRTDPRTHADHRHPHPSGSRQPRPQAARPVRRTRHRLARRGQGRMAEAGDEGGRRPRGLRHGASRRPG